MTAALTVSPIYKAPNGNWYSAEQARGKPDGVYLIDATGHPLAFFESESEASEQPGVKLESVEVAA